MPIASAAAVLRTPRRGHTHTRVRSAKLATVKIRSSEAGPVGVRRNIRGEILANGSNAAAVTRRRGAWRGTRGSLGRIPPETAGGGEREGQVKEQ
eukprot:5968890-Prymnesium_polylepis.1